MTTLLHDSVLDAPGVKIATGIMLRICSGAPTTRNLAVTNTLASIAVVPGDFTFGNGTLVPGDGRKVTVAAKNNVAVGATGTPTTACVDDGTTLLAATDVDPDSPGLTAGSTTNIPAVVFEFGDPVSQ